jgi:hypothetical protein
MATARRPASRTAAPTTPSPSPAAANAVAAARAAAKPTTTQPRRIQTVYKDINDLAAYEWNPRDNAEAVKNVAASIKAFGFLVPCVIDSNDILVAGHTRVEAAKTLGITEIPCIIADHLTPEEVIAFRLIDNKVSEQAKWDFELLAGEMGKLESMGLDFTEFGWSQNEIDCLSDLIAADCLNPATMLPAEEQAGETGHVARRSPQTARYVLGELTFFIPITNYRNWIDGLRQLHNFDEEAMAADVKQRLGIHN